MTNKILEGMARAACDADGCDGDYDKNPPQIRAALAWDMQRGLLWLADNVDWEMTMRAIEAHEAAPLGNGQAVWMSAAIAAALRQAALAQSDKTVVGVSKARDVIAKWSASNADRAQDIPYYDTADMIIAALRAAGLVVVPVEPTQEMMKSAEVRLLSGFDENVYRAMIAASQEDKG